MWPGMLPYLTLLYRHLHSHTPTTPTEAADRPSRHGIGRAFGVHSGGHSISMHRYE